VKELWTAAFHKHYL